MPKMLRKQVYLTDAQDRALHRAAAREQRSEAEILREALDRHLSGASGAIDPKKDALWGGVAVGRGGKSDVSEHVDRYLYGAPKRR